ncbi:radical SAM protein [bacterium]|nr:radical SAM protein [bacterium]
MTNRASNRFIKELRFAASLAAPFAGVLRARYGRGAPTRLPIVYFDITHRCNSACRSCEFWRLANGGPDDLSTGEVLSMIPSLAALGTRVVSIGGGEPTLRHDLETIIAAFSGAGLSIHLNTHGMNIDDARAASLADAGLSMVYVSCDHHKPEGYKAIRGVDGLPKVVRAIRAFRSRPAPVPVGVNVTVMRDNIAVLDELAAFLVGLGVQKIQFTPVHTALQQRHMDRAAFDNLLPTDDEWETAKATLARIVDDLNARGIHANSPLFVRRIDDAYRPGRAVPCVAGFLFVIVEPNGDVKACYNERPAGNIRQAPLEEIVAGADYRAQCEIVRGCTQPCWDIGITEPAIRFHLPYLAAHPIETYRQARAHLLRGA